MRGSLLWFLCIVVGLFGCTQRPRKPPIQNWSLTVESIAAKTQPALSRCDASGNSCSALTNHAQVASGALVRTEADASASLIVPEHGRVWMDEHTDLALVSAAQPTLELRSGGVVAEDHGSKPLALTFLGYEARFDSMLPTRVALQFHAADQVEVTVLRGKLSIRRTRESPLELRSGASVFFSRSRKPERVRAMAWFGAPGFSVAEGPKPSSAPRIARGFGRMTARLPGQTEVVQGVRLASHVVHTQIRDGIARTEIEEIFENQTAQVLGGRYVFPVPPAASISRLALWVGNQLVEGEVLPSNRAASIFHSIVEDTVRPRDPALLEWTSPSEVSLKVFPIPAHGTRKVVLAYDQVLEMDGDEATYVYPLSVGEEGTDPFARFELHVTLSENRAGSHDIRTPGYAAQLIDQDRDIQIKFAADDFLPERDFILHYRRKLGFALDMMQSIAAPGSSPARSFFLARLGVDAEVSVLDQTQTHLERVFVLDASHSQSKESLQAAARITLGLLEQMDPDEQFAVLACDSACRAFPEQGIAAVRDESVHEAKAWLEALAPRGSSDLSAALIAGAQHFTRRGVQRSNAQLIYLGDGAPSSGELRVETIARRTEQTFAAKNMDLRLLGIGSVLDESTLVGLARRLGAAYRRVPLDSDLGRVTAKLHLDLRQPLLKHATFTTTPELAEVCPSPLPALVTGQDVLVLGRVITAKPAKLVLSGDVNGAPYSRSFDVTFSSEPEYQNPYLGRLWAAARISELEARSADLPAILELSRQYRVMSHHTSWLVLENDAMFREYGIGRTVEVATAASGSQASLEMATLGALVGAGSNSVVPQVLRPGAIGSSGDLRLSGSGLSSSGATAASVQVGPPRRRVEFGEVSLSGGEIPNAKRVCMGMRAGFRNCYHRELMSNPDAQGSLLLTMVVGSAGEVVKAVGSPMGTLGSAVTCVEARARSAQFDPPSGGSATIHVQVMFTADRESFFTSPTVNAVPAQTYVPYVAPKSFAIHRLGDEVWRGEGGGRARQSPTGK